MTRYRLDFEYLSPYTGQWQKTYKESKDFEGLMEQFRGQRTMPESVRNSVISKQETTDWTPITLEATRTDVETAIKVSKHILGTIPPVDRSQRVLTDGRPVTNTHREIDPATGMQKGYVVLSAEERAKGFVRPIRTKYTHVGKLGDDEGAVDRIRHFPAIEARQHRTGGCGTVTTMSLALAETYARDPDFYSGTFCAGCRDHFPLDQFVWEGTTEQVGS